MRATVAIETTGNTINEAITTLLHEWRTITEDENADLPTDAEVVIKTADHSTGPTQLYKVQFTARIKIEHGKLAR